MMTFPKLLYPLQTLPFFFNSKDVQLLQTTISKFCGNLSVPVSPINPYAPFLLTYSNYWNGETKTPMNVIYSSHFIIADKMLKMIP